MTKFMTLIAGAALTAATAAPALANDPFVSTQNGQENALNTEAAVAAGAAGVATIVIMLNDGSGSTTTTTTTTATGTTSN